MDFCWCYIGLLFCPSALDVVHSLINQLTSICASTLKVVRNTEDPIHSISINGTCDQAEGDL